MSISEMRKERLRAVRSGAQGHTGLQELEALFLLFPTPSFPFGALAAVQGGGGGADPRCARSQVTQKPHTQPIKWGRASCHSLRDKGLSNPA